MGKEFHIFFSGIVQGVGFRFIAKSLADRNHIKGWVRNLNDGRVEVVAQGGKENIGNFINQIKQRFNQHISNIEREENAIIQEESSFEIRF